MEWEPRRCSGQVLRALFLTIIVILVPSSTTLFVPRYSHPPSSPIPRIGELGHNTLGIQLSVADHFTKNEGQVTEGVFLYARGNPSIAFRSDGILFLVRSIVQTGSADGGHGGIPLDLHDYLFWAEGRVEETVAYLLRFDGANPTIPVGRERLPFNSNFFFGSDPDGWRSNVANFREVVYNGLYDGIDLVYRLTEKGLKYDLVARPGSDLSTISMTFDGISSLDVQDDKLIITTSQGDIIDNLPLSYQEDGREVNCVFKRTGQLSYGFDCDAWDAKTILVIDPLIYSTFLGSTSYETASEIEVDSNGNAYVTGATSSSNFPTTPGAYSNLWMGSQDVYVTKLDPTGSFLIFSTFIGGSDEDFGNSITIDANRNVYAAGWTSSTDFPKTVGAYDTSHNGGRDVFVTKLSQLGDALVYSTYIGGSSWDRAHSIFVDSSNSAYLTGDTGSSGFPTTGGAYDTTFNGDNDWFILKLNNLGSSLRYSTYVGGSGEDEGHTISVDTSGNAYVSGHAGSGDFPTTPGAFDVAYSGTSEGVVVKLNNVGSDVYYITYLGGSNADDAYTLSIDSGGYVYVAGYTNSIDFFTSPAAFDMSYNGGMDAYVTKLNQDGSRAVYSTYVGGGGFDVFYGSRVDPSGNTYLACTTSSSDYPTTPGSVDPSHNGAYDSCMTVVDSNGGSLYYSTFLGGSGNDGGNGIALDTMRGIYLTGYTESANFRITPGAYDTTYNNFTDAFAAKFSFNFPPMAINLGVDGHMYPPGITHIINFNPDLNWTYFDFDNDPQTELQVRVGTAPGLGDMWFPGMQPGAQTVVTYAGAPLLRGWDYWFGVRVSDGYQWSTWTEVLFHVNSIPTPPPSAIDPTDLSSVTPNPNQDVTWDASTDLEGDLITYEWQVAYDTSFTSIIASGTGTTTTSTTFPTSIGDIIYWRARARDDYEPTTWSDYGNAPTGYWTFIIVDNPPVAIAYASVTVAFMNDILTFDGTASWDDVGIIGYLWEFGDGLTDVNVVTTHSYASRRTYVVNLTVWDTSNQSDMDSLSVTIQNRPPIADAGQDVNSIKHLMVVLDGSGSHDDDGDALNYSWTQIAGPTVMLANSDTDAPAFTPTLSGLYTFLLVVDDGWGGVSNDTVNVTVLNRPPIADAGTDRTVVKKILVTLDGSGSSDPDNDTLVYSWIQIGGVTVMLTGADTVSPSFTPQVRGVYTFQLTVDDGDGGNDSDIVQVTATNGEPIADAGLDRTVAKKILVTLDGSGSNDPDNDTLTYYWWQIGGVSVILTGADTVSPSFTPQVRGVYTFQLTVDDGDGGTDNDTVQVTVTNGDPVADAGLDKGVWKMSVIMLDGSRSTDPDGDTLTYTWVQTSGPGVMLAGGNTVSATFTPGVCSVFTFTLTVDDGDGGVDTDSVSITTWGMPPTPVLTATPSDIYVGFEVHFDADGSYDVDGTIVDYKFDFDDGIVVNGSSINRNHIFSTSGAFDVKLMVTDDDGNSSVTMLTVFVEPPIPEPNFKPLIALIFAIVLGLVGIWTARKRPWKGVPTREATLKTWMYMVSPFVIVEAVTGIFSLLTGLLRVPPIVGIGTIVDVIILVVGLSILLILAYTGRMDEDQLDTDAGT